MIRTIAFSQSQPNPFGFRESHFVHYTISQNFETKRAYIQMTSFSGTAAVAVKTIIIKKNRNLSDRIICFVLSE